MIEKEKELNKAAQRLVFLSDYLQVKSQKPMYNRVFSTFGEF